MSWILFVLYFFGFGVIILKSNFFNNKIISKKILLVFFIIKISVGVLLNFIYSNYYENRSDSDIFKYFDDSKYIHKSLNENPLHFVDLLIGSNDENISLKPYLDSTLNWKCQSKAYSDLTKTANNTFSNHRTITKFNAIVRIFSFGNLSIHVLFMCFVSLVGCFLIFKAYIHFINVSNIKIFSIVVFLMPSILIWSSGVLKEGLIVFGFGVFIYSLIRIADYDYKVKYFVSLIFSIGLLFITKYYIIILLMPIAVLYVIPLKSKTFTLIKYLFPISVIFILFISNNSINNIIIDKLDNKRNEQERISFGGYYYVQSDNVNNQKQLVRFDTDVKNFESPYNSNIINDSLLIRLKPGLKYQIYSRGLYSEYLITDSIFSYSFLDGYLKAGSYYDLPKIEESSPLSLIFNTPKAFFNVLTKPFYFLKGSIMLRLASLENLGLIFIVIYLLLFRRIRIRHLNLLIFNLLFLFQLYVLIGFTSPVLGGMFRYKMLGVLIFVISLLMVFEKKKVNEDSD